MKHTGIKRLIWFALPAALLLLSFGGCKGKQPMQVLLISIDTLRSDHLSAYGYERNTSPHLDALSRDAVFYKHAYPNGCWTMPSHVSLLTGALPSRHGINKDWRSTHKKKYPKLNTAIKTLAEVLKGADKAVQTLKFASLPDELGFGRGFDVNRRMDPFDNDGKFNLLLKRLEAHKDGGFFFFLHTWWVHTPYTHSHYLRDGVDEATRKAVDDFKRMSKKERGRLLGREAKKLDADFVDFLKRRGLFNARDCIDLYDGGVRYVDRYIGKLLAKVRELGIYDNLMIIVVSDHGEHLGEHLPKRFYGLHGNDYFEEFIEVPLIIKYPHADGGKVVTHPVSLVDVVPTVLDYYKIEIPEFVQGESLRPARVNRKRRRIVSEAITNHNVEKKMLRVGDLKYIVTMKNPGNTARVDWDNVTKRRLFNLEDDPEEKKNLAKDARYAETLQLLEKTLKAILKDSVSPGLSPDETRIDKKTIDQLKALGYL